MFKPDPSLYRCSSRCKKYRYIYTTKGLPFKTASKTHYILSSHFPLLTSLPHTSTHRLHTTWRHSWLIYIAAIQMCIAEDIWWFSNLCSCHGEMGRADPCHPESESQTAHISISISLHSRFQSTVVSFTCSPNVRKYSTVASSHFRVGVTCSAAARIMSSYPRTNVPDLQLQEKLEILKDMALIANHCPTIISRIDWQNSVFQISF